MLDCGAGMKREKRERGKDESLFCAHEHKEEGKEREREGSETKPVAVGLIFIWTEFECIEGIECVCVCVCMCVQ